MDYATCCCYVVTSGGCAGIGATSYDWITAWKMPIWKPCKVIKGNMKLTLREIDCYVGRRTKPVQDRVQEVLHLQVLLPEDF